MTTPIVMIVGPAGSGKDTVAGFLAEQGGVCIAQADPMKRFARDVFGFSEIQLWGASEMRNAVDPRGTSPDFWAMTERYFDFANAAESAQSIYWLRDVFGNSNETLERALFRWFDTHVVSQEELTPRHVLQTLGTEFGRKLRDDVWVNYAQRVAQRLLEENATYDRLLGVVPRASGRTEFVVITDGRFRNEVLATKRAGGIVLKVTGPQVSGLAGAAGKHASEQEQNSIPDFWFDAVIWNDKSKGLEKLKTLVGMVKESVVQKPPFILTPYGRIAV